MKDTKVVVTRPHSVSLSEVDGELVPGELVEVRFPYDLGLYRVTKTPDGEFVLLPEGTDFGI